MAIILTQNEIRLENEAVSYLRRNRPEIQDWSDPAFVIAALRVYLSRGPSNAGQYKLVLYKLMEMHPDIANNYIVVSAIPPSNVIWREIERLSRHYYNNNRYNFGSFPTKSGHEMVLLNLALRSANSFPAVLLRSDVLSLGRAIKNHLRAIENGARSVTCSKCSSTKIVNSTCEVCGFMPRAVVKRQAVKELSEE